MSQTVKRIEFTLNLDDPQEAALFRALYPSLCYRRAGSVIRHALSLYLLPKPVSPIPTPEQVTPNKEASS